MLPELIIITTLSFLIGYNAGRNFKQNLKRKQREKANEWIVGDRELFWRHNFHNEYTHIFENKN